MLKQFDRMKSVQANNKVGFVYGYAFYFIFLIFHVYCILVAHKKLEVKNKMIKPAQKSNFTRDTAKITALTHEIFQFC